MQDGRNASNTASTCANIFPVHLLGIRLKKKKKRNKQEINKQKTTQKAKTNQPTKAREKNRKKSGLHREMEHQNGGGGKDVG